MIANYHTHTWRCHHAVGTEREYVERAIEGGIKIMGFSDHTPYHHLNAADSRVRMLLTQMDDYTDTVLRLRDEYKKDIEIHLGLEVEYYPDFFEELMRFLEDYPVEYLIQGQHFLDNERPGDRYSGSVTSDPALLRKYVDQCIEGMETGAFLYLAHPDLLNFSGDEGVRMKEYRRLCAAAKEKSIPLEINFLGIWDHRWYPNDRFWEAAGETGNTVIFGCDAHQADKAWNPQAERIALDMVEKNHLHLVDKLELQSRRK